MKHSSIQLAKFFYSVSGIPQWLTKPILWIVGRTLLQGTKKTIKHYPKIQKNKKTKNTYDSYILNPSKIQKKRYWKDYMMFDSGSFRLLKSCLKTPHNYTLFPKFKALNILWFEFSHLAVRQLNSINTCLGIILGVKNGWSCRNSSHWIGLDLSRERKAKRK